MIVALSIVGSMIGYAMVGSYTFGYYHAVLAEKHGTHSCQYDMGLADRWFVACAWPIYWGWKFLQLLSKTVLLLPNLAKLGFSHKQSLVRIQEQRIRIKEEKLRVEAEHMAEVEAALKDETNSKRRFAAHR